MARAKPSAYEPVEPTLLVKINELEMVFIGCAQKKKLHQVGVEDITIHQIGCSEFPGDDKVEP